MSEDFNIDELLNGFIDGELTARHQTEVQRLIKHDAQIEERLHELEKCKMLVGSLPRAEAPAGMAERVRASVSTGAPPVPQIEYFDRGKGSRHLLVRKLIAAAAMIGLVAVLAVLVYTIVAPEDVPEKSVVSEDWHRPVRKIEMPKPEPTTVAVVEESDVEPRLAPGDFDPMLELKTTDLIAVDAFINRSIEDNGLLDYVTAKTYKDKKIYTLGHSAEQLGALLADLDSIWVRFDSARLFVETGRFAERVMIDAVSTEQIAEILEQDDTGRIELAKDFAALNKMVELLPGREILAAIDSEGPDLITIPRPVLTSKQEAIKEPEGQAEAGEKIHLSIVVIGSE